MPILLATRTIAALAVCATVLMIGFLGRITGADAATASSCGPIAWELQADFPEDLRADVEAGIALLGSLTGRETIFLGTVDRAPVNVTRAGSVFVGVGDPADGLLTPGALATTATFAPSDGSVSADVALDATRVRALPAGSGPGGRALLVLHELGHALGLDHADHGLMAPTHGPETVVGGTDRDALAGRGCAS